MNNLEFASPLIATLTLDQVCPAGSNSQAGGVGRPPAGPVPLRPGRVSGGAGQQAPLPPDAGHQGSRKRPLGVKENIVKVINLIYFF
jgi:hypothetical protein